MNKPEGRPLYVKNPLARQLAEKVSKKMGVTLTDAVIRSLEDAITQKMAALPILDSRTEDEILGYDEFGIPR